MLFLDSTWVLGQGLNGQIIVNIFLPTYFIGMYLTMPDDRIKNLMILTVPVSAIGELVLSQGVELWIYKGGTVPFYVPFGHGIVVGTGFQILWREAVHQNAPQLLRGFLVLYATLFIGAYFIAQDSFTLALGILFFIGIFGMKKPVIYVFMPLLVLFVEFAGTSFGCWYWPINPFGFLSTTNPPVGSVMFYVYLDIIVVAISGQWIAAGWRRKKVLP